MVLIFSLSLEGRLRGEGLHRQNSVRYGGVIPSFAMGWHAKNVQSVVQTAIDEAGISMDQ